MAKIAYIHRVKWYKSSLATIERVNIVLDEFMADGYTATVRQIYYQFVARKWIENTIARYKNLGEIINSGRLAGLIDWDAIEDRTRGAEQRRTFNDNRDALGDIIARYWEDPWRNQPRHIEVFVEKEALVGVISRVCNKRFVTFLACRGYLSQSEAKVAGERLAWYAGNGQEPLVLHFGDHDPSGVDMTRDNIARLEMFAGQPIELRRLALNMDQIDEWNPPSAPAKTKDARIEGYKRKTGTSLSWELDALSPRTIAEILDKELHKEIDPELWLEAYRDFRPNRVRMKKLLRHWGSISKFLDNRKPLEPK